MGQEYIDIYGFTPLPPALRKLLEKICEQDSDVFQIEALGDTSDLKELEDLGYLHEVGMDFSCNAFGFVTSKGQRYSQEYKEWELRKQQWGDARKQEERAAKRHDWSLSIVNGVYAIVAAVIGGLLGFIFGKM